MTKTIIIGEKNKETPNKPIQFSSFLTNTASLSSSVIEPTEFQFIELICRNYTVNGEDLMFAYDSESERNRGALYLGKWNSGKVDLQF